MSGKRETIVQDSFVEHMRRKPGATRRASSMEEIALHVHAEIEEVLKKIEENKKVITSGTKVWQEIDSLTAEMTGNENKEFVARASGKFILGRSNK